VSELIGVVACCLALLAWVTWDLLRTHGSVLRVLEERDPSRPQGASAPVPVDVAPPQRTRQL